MKRAAISGWLIPVKAKLKQNKGEYHDNTEVLQMGDDLGNMRRGMWGLSDFCAGEEWQLGYLHYRYLDHNDSLDFFNQGLHTGKTEPAEMIVKLKGGQRQGKGLVMVRIALHLLGHCGYKPDKCVSNFTFNVNGTHRLDIEHLVGFMQRMIASKLSGMMILIQEADRAFPPRMWHDPKQTQALLGCWQDEKLDNMFIIDCHWGDVDLMLRQACQIEIIPKYRPKQDLVELGIIDIINHKDPVYAELPHISEVFSWYNTYEPIS